MLLCCGPVCFFRFRRSNVRRLRWLMLAIYRVLMADRMGSCRYFNQGLPCIWTAVDMPSKDGTDLTQPLLGPRSADAALDTAPITTDAESVDCTDFTDAAGHQALKSGSVRRDNVAIHRFCIRCSGRCRTVIAVVSKADSANGIPAKGWFWSTPKCGVSKAACVSQCWFK